MLNANVETVARVCSLFQIAIAKEASPWPYVESAMANVHFSKFFLKWRVIAIEWPPGTDRPVVGQLCLENWI